MNPRRIGVALAALPLALGIVGTGAVINSASAHNIGLTGEASCPENGTWGVKVKASITNTPSDDTAETKVITTSAGTLTTTGGTGVKSGNQLILNAWYEHRNNWPGVKTRMGNWSDYYTISGIPNSVTSVTTMVQVDWKKWNSVDIERTFNKPTNCTEYVPKHEVRHQDVTNPPNCTDWTVTTEHQTSSRDETSQGVWGPWSPWVTTSTSSTAATEEQCKPEAPEPEAQYRDTSTKPTCTTQSIRTTTEKRTREPVWDAVSHSYVWGEWSAWTTVNEFFTQATGLHCDRHYKVRTKVVDRCSCRKDDVIMTGNPDKVKIYKHRVNRTTWRFVVEGKSVNGHQYLLPKRLKGLHTGWAASQVYTVHTTAKPCPCKVRGDCHKLYPHFNPPHNCVSRLEDGRKVCH